MVKKNNNYWEREELDKRRNPAHYVVKEYVMSKIDEITKILSIKKNMKLLDVGCGNGFFSYYFDKICYTFGIDLSHKMIAMNPIRNKIIMDSNNIAFKDNTFDVVFAHALLHHVENINKVICELKRVSREYIIILEPNRNNPFMFLFALFNKEERRVLMYSSSFLKESCENSGLKIIDLFSHGMIVPNKTPLFLMPLLRLFNFRQIFGVTNFIIAKKRP